MEKVYSELTDDELDVLGPEEISDYTGFYEPETDEDGETEWHVTTRNKGLFVCRTQENAHILANTEMILEMMLRDK